jgi:hypothetical protein
MPHVQCISKIPQSFSTVGGAAVGVRSSPPGLHGVGGAAVPYYAYKFNFSTRVAVRVFWQEPVEPSILLLFTRVFI